MMIVAVFEGALCVPKLYYGALLGLGFCVYYLCEVVKVSRFSKGPPRDPRLRSIVHTCLYMRVRAACGWRARARVT